jgi:hypothetical protein
MMAFKYLINLYANCKEIVIGFDERVSLDGNHKAQVVKTLHESVQQQIEKRNHVYATKAQ